MAAGLPVFSSKWDSRPLSVVSGPLSVVSCPLSHVRFLPRTTDYGPFQEVPRRRRQAARFPVSGEVLFQALEVTGQVDVSTGFQD